MNGQLLKITGNKDTQEFPDAKFIIQGTPPADQCSEAKIEGDSAISAGFPDFNLTDAGKFAGYALTGKVCHITASVGGNLGDFAITGHNDNELFFGDDPGNGNPVTYYVTDGGSLILTRNESSFAKFIHTAGYAYTIKGGKLYTNIPPGQLRPACTIEFNPEI